MADQAEVESLRREVEALRQRVAELQRKAGRYDEVVDALPPAGSEISVVERVELLREVERMAHMGSWVWNLEAGTVFWSEGLYRILGYDPATQPATPERFFERIHPDDRERVRKASVDAVEEGMSSQVDCRVQRPDGSVRYVSMDGAMLFDDERRLRRMVGTLLDITGAREAERRLEEANRQLEEAQAIAHMGSWSLDIDSGSWAWSPEVFRILDVPESTPASFELFLERTHPEDRERLRRGHTAAVAARVDGEFQGRIVRSDGEVRAVRIKGTALRGAGGVPIRRGILLDVTDMTRLQERLARSERMEAIGRLAGGIAHDFNNLLMVMSGSVELLDGGPREALVALENSIESAASLTKRLLAFGRQSPMRPRPFQLNDVIRTTLGLVERVLGPQITVATRLDPELPLAQLDPHLTGQALMNLLINARDAMPDGGTITVATRPLLDGSHERVEVTVQDSGCGMTEELRTRVFEPFFTTKRTGTGLGLSMVHGAILQQEGTIAIDAPDAGGTCFVVRLPRSAAGAKAASEVPRSVRGPAAVRLTVLVVEDQPAVAAILKRTLERDGYRVFVAGRPSEATQMVNELEHSLDLIICDLVMPEMSGPRLIEQLANRGALPAVVYISGYGADAIADADPKHPLLSKPFTSAELRAAVRRALPTTE